MTPYYEHDGITIYHGDALEVLPTLEASSCVVSDPPYGIDDAPLHTTGGKRGAVASSNVWHPPSDWDAAIDPEWARASARVAPIVAWFGNWRKRLEVENAMPLPLRAEIVWAKNCHVGPPCPLAMRDERIWVFAESGIVGRVFETSVWDEPIIPTWERKFHKNEKPLGLMCRLLAWLPDGPIIDPFMGSGTTLLAARFHRRIAVGIEKDEQYCEVAARRLNQGALAL